QPSEQEQALEQRARELQKQAKKLQDEVDRSGLGADLKPVPEPTVRDLSVPEARSARMKKTLANGPSHEPAPADEGEVIPAHVVAAARTEDVLGRKSETPEKLPERKPVEGSSEAAVLEKGEKRGEPAVSAEQPEPTVTIDGVSPKPKPGGR